MRYRPIGDYAIIGDTRSAALISSEGSLDWLCFPRFDSPAMFLRLLDAERGGYCWLRPAGHFEVSRGYVRDSCLLQTRFKTSTGTMNVIDFMPVRRTKDNDRKGTDTEAAHQVIRLVQCTGDVDCIIEIKATPDYAREKPKIVRRNDHRAVILGARDALHVQVPAPCEVGDDGVLRGKLPMNDGDEFALVLAWSEPEADVREVSLNDARRTLEETADYWREWSNDLEYEGDYRELVHRSALTLKLLTYEPTGAIVASPTTSLPEAIGGERNWDYRYSWLRDSSLTLVALMDLGKFGEAHDYFHFLHDSFPERAEDVQVMYRIDGGRDLRETELPLAGYADSLPVRTGNAAVHQQQLDIFGEVMHCAYLYWMHEDFLKHGESFHRDFWPVVQRTADFVAQHWREAGNGIWEVRGPQKQFTHTEGMCWVALDRALKLARRHEIRGGLAHWEREREAIRREIEERGFHPEVGAYVQSFDGVAMDAAILRLPLMGVIDPASRRMQSTIAAIERRLMRNGLLYRYRQDETDDGLSGSEGTFTACAFWLVENYVLQGRLEDAQRLFEHTVSFANDLGLLSEELDAETGEQLGNFPQGFTHVGLVNAAVRIAIAKGQVSDAARRMLCGEAGTDEHAA